MSLALALLASLLWGAADYGGGSLSQRLPVLAVTLGSQLAGLLGVVVLVLVTGGPAASRTAVLWGLLGGVVLPVALGAFYRALATGLMSVVAPVAATGVVVPVVVGVLAGDRPSGAQWSGLAAAVVGVVLAGVAGGQDGEAAATSGARPLLLAVVAALGFGTLVVCVGRGSAASVGTTLLAQRLVAVALLGGTALARRDLVPLGSALGSWRPLLLVGLADAGALAAYGFASRGEVLAVVAVLASLYPVVTVLLARQRDGERLTRLQAAGVVTAMAGVLLLSVQTA